ncbi:ead/Ea22-like family protein [Escherichia coli]|uniref:ead/Ea22-like family protein n=1 Tax=Escherichia coli TaxID=562 RepID=UPI001A128568|nr:ead/Ea22-like family protein [Escherichia coli]MCU6295592.1 ead/Ea22-like family protein [Escherichia coli]MCV8496684.1 ead/Ea22-like family protein [Escherichia coli]MCV8818174.1 ead/Ea22-like family protein [Escherichia coli]MCV9173145.1 ead/Ea22-like family protein [Escherichia coli]MDE7863568.1 ead/Ea22-like family protein [Escherichia coli]
MSNIDKQALREAAEKATPGNWWIDSHGQSMVSFIDNEVLEVFTTDNKRVAVRHEDTGNLSRWRNDNDATFIATADPATVLALLDELEAAEKRIAELEAKLETADKLQDSAFRHGLQHGFSLGQTDNQDGFEECLSAYGARGKDNG